MVQRREAGRKMLEQVRFLVLGVLAVLLTAGEPLQQIFATELQENSSKTLAGIGASFENLADVSFPKTPAVVDVTQPPYGALGDGVTDDTDAIERAIHESVGMHRVIYFPAGTYLVSRTIRWPKKSLAGREAWGHTRLQGQNVRKTTIKLKSNTFNDPKNPQSIMWCGGFGSADWFHNYVQDLTFDVGESNAGAIGLQFYSNNSGAVRNCRFQAAAGSGHIGLDLAHRDMNGPLLVRNCEIKGFGIGISTANSVNGQTFEHITLVGQRECGFSNAGQTISIRGLRSKNEVTAIRSYGSMCLIESRLSGSKGANRLPAIVNFNYGRICLRDIETAGYARALADLETPDAAASLRVKGEDKPGSLGPVISEYFSHPVTSPFRSSSSSIRLPIRESPDLIADPVDQWANVNDFGADPTGETDSAAAIQRAMDSGATTVFFPGFYALKSTILVRGKVRRIVGVGAWVDYRGEAKPDFCVQEGESPLVSFEHFSHMHGGIEIDTDRTMFFRSACDSQLTFTSKSHGSDLYFEDVCTSNLRFKSHRVWARQLNVENEGTHLTNDASDVWILGYKTERGGTLVDTRQGGRSEVLGGFSYTTTAGKLGPMFRTEDSSVFAFFAEVCYNGDPYQTWIQEMRRGEEKRVERGQGDSLPYASSWKP
jgi:hypothetical protein